MSMESVVTNDPVVLFVLPGGTEYTARALPIAKAHAWLKNAIEISAELDNLGEMDSEEAICGALDGVMTRMYDAVVSYDPSWDREFLLSRTTPGQLADAFYRLMEINSPFAALGRRRLASMEAAARSIAGLSGQTRGPSALPTLT